MVKSPRLSFKGYQLGIALYNNKDAIKALVALLGVINVGVGFDWKTLGISFAGGFLALVVKLIIDAVDYFFTEVDLPDKK